MENTKKILIVDDEASMRRNIVDYLSMKGYSLLEAESGEEAIEIITSTPLDLIILDINLPKMSGLDVLKLTKKDNPDLPCLLLTAYGTSDKAIKAMKLGAFDYLEKPFELDEFQMIIERALKHNELLKELKQLR